MANYFWFLLNYFLSHFRLLFCLVALPHFIGNLCVGKLYNRAFFSHSKNKNQGMQTFAPKCILTNHLIWFVFFPRKCDFILSPLFTEIHQGLRGAGLRVQPHQPVRKRLLRPALLRLQPSDSEYRHSTTPHPPSCAETLLYTLEGWVYKKKKLCTKGVLRSEEWWSLPGGGGGGGGGGGLNARQGDEKTFKEKHYSSFSITSFQHRRDLCLRGEPQNLSGLVFPTVVLLSTKIYCWRRQCKNSN